MSDWCGYFPFVNIEIRLMLRLALYLGLLSVTLLFDISNRTNLFVPNELLIFFSVKCFFKFLGDQFKMSNLKHFAFKFEMPLVVKR